MRHYSRRHLGPGPDAEHHAVDHSVAIPAAGARLLQTTQSFNLPYRASRDATGHCAASGFYPWYSAAEGKCFNGFAHEVTFALPAGQNLPNELIWSIAFNTQTHGYNPTGVSGPYNSLNVGAQSFSGQPSAGTGTDTEPDGAFTNSTWSGGYGDNGAGGIGMFRDDAGWADNRPLACFGTACPLTAPVTSPSASESVLSATSDPSATEAVGGETSGPNPPTAPPTSTGDPGEPNSGSTFALLICAASAAAALVAVGVQRRSARR